MTKFETMCETYQHKGMVHLFINIVVAQLLHRSNCHDDSKLEYPEVDIFTEFTPKLANSTYGSEEYKQFLQEMKPALDHHYAENKHHPEHYQDGIKGMDLIDLIEMMCDWKAASMRHKNGDIIKSIEINQKRFGYSDDLKEIFKNTVKYF